MRANILSDRTSGIYLPTESAVRKARAAFARSATGGGPARILFKGDSTTYGTLGGGGNGASGVYNPGALTNPSQISWVDRCRRLLTTTGDMGGRVDEGAIWTAASTNDTRFVGGTGWGGGGSWSATTSTVGDLVFTDAGTQANAYDLWVIKTSGSAVTFNVTIGAETPVVVDLSGQATNSVITAKRVTSTVGVGAHTVTIGPPTGGNIQIYAFEPLNLVTPPVARFSRHGISGQQLGVFMSSGSTQAGGQYWLTHTQYVPDATVLLMGINDLHFTADVSYAAAAATYKAALVSYVTSTQALGADVVIGTFPSSGYAVAGLTPGPYEAVRSHQVIYEVADQYNCAVFDLARRWGYAAVGSGPSAYTGTPTPTPMYDGVHPTLAGYQDMARMMARFFSHVV